MAGGLYPPLEHPQSSQLRSPMNAPRMRRQPGSSGSLVIPSDSIHPPGGKWLRRLVAIDAFASSAHVTISDSRVGFWSLRTLLQLEECEWKFSGVSANTLETATGSKPYLAPKSTLRKTARLSGRSHAISEDPLGFHSDDSCCSLTCMKRFGYAQPRIFRWVTSRQVRDSDRAARFIAHFANCWA